MRSRCTLAATAVFAALVACSDGGTGFTPAGNGGAGGGTSSPGHGGGTQSASGGASATGGTTASGGSSVAGGMTASGGQSSGTGGQGGRATGGTTTSGGQGGSEGGAGGRTTTGGGGGSGGAATGGSGGVTTGGKTGAGGTRTGGAGGSGGTATGGVAGNGSGGATGGAGATGRGGATGSGGVTASGGTTGSGGNSGAQHWVGTWSASPYYDSGNQPPTSLANAVLRQIAHVSLGGGRIRVQFSNLFGNGSVTIKSAHIASCKATSLVDSTIDAATDKALAFSGAESVTIAQGKEVWSDPIDFTIANQGNITITTAFGSVPSQVVGHSGSRTTSYIQTGSSTVNAASMTSATKTDHWYYISGIDVMADAAAVAVVAIGDSITDGRGTTTNGNNRWTDIMATRLQANAATAKVATMNQGIGATNLIGSSGTAGQARFSRDVLGQSGVKYAIVFHGVNDINGGASFASLKAAYDDLIKRAHDSGLRIYGGTILPFGGNTGGFYSVAHESVRQQANDYIKSGAFDGVIDFDAALTDGGNPPKLKAEYAAWAEQDGLHPGPAGYQKMGEAVDLALLAK